MSTLRIDRTFEGVGRLARFSGTTHAPTFARINAMLSGLYNVGRLDVLEWIRDGVHAPLVVLHHWERGILDRLPRPDAAGGLVAALWRFHATHEASKKHRSGIGTSIRHVEKAATKASTVGDLPSVLRKRKDAMRETPVAFNRLRAHMLAFASETQGRNSPLWIAVSQVNRFKKVDGKARGKLRRPLTVAELDAVCAAFVDVPVHGGRKGSHNKGKLALRRTILARDLAAMTRMLATTGMRPAEYWQRLGASWSCEHSRTGALYVQVNGTKTRAATRPTFCLTDSPVPVCGEQFYRRAFTEACERSIRAGLDAYSLRRTFAKLCEDAGVVESRRKAYMGHGPATVTEIYLHTNVLPFVAQDAAIVAAYMEAERARVRTSHMEIAR